MGNFVVKLAGGIGVIRQFLLSKKRDRSTTIAYITATTIAGCIETSMMEFALNDLFTLLEAVWGKRAREMLGELPILPVVQKALDAD